MRQPESTSRSGRRAGWGARRSAHKRCRTASLPCARCNVGVRGKCRWQRRRSSHRLLWMADLVGESLYRAPPAEQIAALAQLSSLLEPSTISVQYDDRCGIACDAALSPAGLPAHRDCRPRRGWPAPSGRHTPLMATRFALATAWCSAAGGACRPHCLRRLSWFTAVAWRRLMSGSCGAGRRAQCSAGRNTDLP